MRVGLFDSGIGGLTVLKTLIKKYPHCDYIYYGDTLNLPYGDKTHDELIKLADDDIKFLLSKNVDMIIIACGTISSNCFEYLKEKYNIPIKSILIDTTEYLNSINSNVLVIATKATINSHFFKNNIKREIIEVETPLLVPLIEGNDINKLNKVLHDYLDKYISKYDMLVLGCTHYPIIYDNIKYAVGNNIRIIDMSEYISLTDIGNGEREIYFSKLNDTIINNTKKILSNDDISISCV